MVIQTRRVQTGTDFGQEWLVDNEGHRIDVTTFGGRPIYETRYEVGHG